MFEKLRFGGMTMPFRVGPSDIVEMQIAAQHDGDVSMAGSWRRRKGLFCEVVGFQPQEAEVGCLLIYQRYGGGGGEIGGSVVYWKFRLGFEPEKLGVPNSTDILPLNK